MNGVKIRIIRLNAYIYNMVFGRPCDYYLRYTFDRIKRITGEVCDKAPRPLTILDIGCGFAYPATAILSALGHTVQGIDIINCFLKDSFSRQFQYRKESVGPIRATIETPFFYFQGKNKMTGFSRALGKSINWRSADVAAYDGTKLPYPQNHFDAIISQDVLEHVMEIDIFWSEVFRTLKPGGKFDMIYHNFYSPSGSHAPVNPEDPWHHLGIKSNVNKHSSLNRKHPVEIAIAAEKSGLRVTDVRKVAFNGAVENVDEDFSLEGLKWANPRGRQAEESVEKLFHNYIEGRWNIRTRELPYVSRWLVCGRKG
jgi:SAM-dependent methyltransferase